MEIERKYLVKKLPKLDNYSFADFEQSYISTNPVIRLRSINHRDYILTVKSKGYLSREEFELPLTEEQYVNLLLKAEGNIISKRRYFIPLENGLTAELDVYHKNLKNLFTVEVEFDTEEQAKSFIAPDWFGEDITYNPAYKNSSLSKSSTKIM